MSGRFPFTSFPDGWFQAAYGDELARGQVLPLRYFGKDLVLFRTEEGKPHVLDAHCPHMGAHLGYGGRVEEGCLRCPFHGWRFSASGASPENKTSVRPWPVREINGLIMVFHHRSGRKPSYAIPPLPEYGSGRWMPYVRCRWKIRTHVQEILENAMDAAHFHSMHGFPKIPKIKLTAKSHAISSRMSVLVRGQGTRLSEETIRWDSVGPGYGVMRVPGVVKTTAVFSITPIDEDFVDARISILTRKGGPPGFGEARAAGIAREFQGDIPIWENKIYLSDPPGVGAAQRAVLKMRAWFRQFTD